MNFSSTLLVLRLFRLGALPPAQAQVAILNECGLPVHVLEFGNVTEPNTSEAPSWARTRWACPPAALVPKILRPSFIFAVTLLRLCFSFLLQGRPRFLLAEGLQEEGLVYALHHLFRIPFAVHVHELPVAHELSRFNRTLLRLEPILFKKAAFLIFPQADRANLVRSRCQLTTPTHVVFNCPRLRKNHRNDSLKERLGLSGNPFFMIYMGGIGANNPLEIGIASLTQSPLNVHFVICGWGETKFTDPLEALAKQLNVQDRVHFLGVIKEAKWEILDSSHLGYCLYSQAEDRLEFQATASNKIMESISSGLPVVCSKTRDAESFLQKYPAGITVADSQGLAGFLRSLIESPAEWNKWSERCRELHVQELNYEHQMQHLLPEFTVFFPEQTVGLERTSRSPVS